MPTPIPRPTLADGSRPELDDDAWEVSVAEVSDGADVVVLVDELVDLDSDVEVAVNEVEVLVARGLSVILK